MIEYWAGLHVPCGSILTLQDTSVILVFYLRRQAVRILGKKGRDLPASKPANPNRTEYKIVPGCPELAVLSRPTRTVHVFTF